MHAPLPPTNTFVGPVDPEGRLAELWRRGVGLLSIVGLPGVGKTRRLRQLLVDRGPVRWLESGPVPPRIEEPALVLDGWEELSDADLARCEALACEVLVVCTRREPLGIEGEAIVVVPMLSVTDAVELLVTRAREQHVPTDHLGEELEPLAARLDGVPRALEEAVTWLETTAARRLLQDLDRSGADHPLLAHWRTVWATWSAERQQAITALTAFETGFDLGGAAAVWGVPEAEAVERSAALRRLGLLRAVGPGRFELLGGVRQLACQGLSAERARELWLRHGHHLARVDLPANWLGVRSDWRPLPPEAESAELLAAARRLRDVDPLLAVRSALALAVIGSRNGQTHAPIRALQDLVDPVAALPDTERWQFRQHYLLSHLHAVGGSVDLAVHHSRQALTLLPADTADRHRILLRQLLAWSLWRQGAPDQALATAAEGRVVARQAGDSHHEVEFLGIQAMVHAEAGRQAAADACLEAISEVARTLSGASLGAAWVDVCARYLDPPARLHAPDATMEARVGTTTSLARATTLWWLGRIGEARTVLDDLPDLGRHPTLAQTEAALRGALAVVDGDPSEAIGPILVKLRAMEVSGCLQGTVAWRIALAGALWRTGSTAQACGELKRATDESERVGMTVLADELRCVLAVCMAELGANDAARTLLERLQKAWPMRWYQALHTLACAIVDRGPAHGQAPGPADRWSQQLLQVGSRRTVLAGGEPQRLLRVGPGARWLDIDGRRVDLSTRATARRFVSALLGRHLDEPGSELTFDGAIDATWPGQRILPESASRRLHTLVWQLRRMGLEDVLITTALGYALAEDIRIVEGET